MSRDRPKLLGNRDESRGSRRSEFKAGQAERKALEAIAGNIELVPRVENAEETAEEAEQKADDALALATDLQSDNFVPGEAGWRIERGSGDAEFNDVDVRGYVESVDSYPEGSYVSVVDAGGFGVSWERTDGVRLPAGQIRSTVTNLDDPSMGAGELALMLGGGNNASLELYDNQTAFLYGSMSFPSVSGASPAVYFGGAGASDSTGSLSAHQGWFTAYTRGSAGSEGFRVRGGTGSGYENLLQVATSGMMRANRDGWPTTSADANVRLFTGDTAENARLARVTSSRQFKQDIETYDEGPGKLEALRTVWFRDRAEVAEQGRGGARFYVGLIAEEVHDAGVTELVEYDEHGAPAAISYSRVGAMLLPEVQRLRQENEELQARVEALESRLDAAGL